MPNSSHENRTTISNNLLVNSVATSQSLQYASDQFNSFKSSKTVQSAIETGQSIGSQVKEGLDIGGDIGGGGELFIIGKPCKFPKEIDPNGRINKLLKAKMNVVDLIPCDYKMDITKDGDKEGIHGLVPTIKFGKATQDFSKICGNYGLQVASGIRIYTTDETTSMDNFNNQYTDNFFQGVADRASEMGQNLKAFQRSINSNMDTTLANAAQNLKDEGMNLISGAASSAADFLEIDPETQSQISQGVSGMADVAIEAMISGKRISFPQIWTTSSYDPSLTLQVKLVSPYGTPEAVKEFIIKPITYLLILGTPKTDDGVSYGHPFPLTIKAYGLGYTPLGGITNISLRRGGGDTSFNLFRQPLTVDVSITFQYLNAGFATYGPDANPEGSEFSNSHMPTDQSIGSGPDEMFPAMPTLGKIIRSLRPVDFEGFLGSGGSSSSNMDRTSSISMEQSTYQSVNKHANDITEEIKLNWLSESDVNIYLDNMLA